MSNSVSKYVPVPLSGIDLLCLQKDDDVWIAFEPLCDRLGVDRFYWQSVLSRPDYKDIKFKDLSHPDYPKLKVAHIHFRSVPAWLYMIPPSNVAVGVRPRLVDIREQCTKAIERYFFPASNTTTALPPVPSSQGGLIPLEALIAGALQHLGKLQTEVSSVRQQSDLALQTALAAMGMQVTDNRDPYVSVLACAEAWRLSSRTNEDMAQLGREICANARATGWFHLVNVRAKPTAGHSVNTYPSREIFLYFTNHFGRCPVPQIATYVDHLRSADA